MKVIGRLCSQFRLFQIIIEDGSLALVLDKKPYRVNKKVDRRYNIHVNDFIDVKLHHSGMIVNKLIDRQKKKDTYVFEF